ncbi:hypothetical protein, partial [Profundibacterium mesophilum]|uniref:hypothetical protein n=1 Tax=Profundibacterium mesophilum TaxID=1258573 RepID=UPI001F2CE0D1
MPKFVSAVQSEVRERGPIGRGAANVVDRRAESRVEIRRRLDPAIRCNQLVARRCKRDVRRRREIAPDRAAVMGDADAGRTDTHLQLDAGIMRNVARLRAGDGAVEAHHPRRIVALV